MTGRLIRTYTLNRFIHWAMTGLLFPVMVLLILAKDLDLFQAGAIVSTYSATIILLELPTGGLSDTIGRKRVYLLSMGANLIAVLVLILAWDLYTTAAGFLFLGVGRALSSGSIDAWFVDEFYRVNGNTGLQPAIAKAEIASAVGISVASVIGGLLPMTLGRLTSEVEGWDIYTGNLLVIGAMIIVQSVLTQRMVAENLEHVEDRSAMAGLRKLPETLASSMQYGVRNRVILLLMVGTVVLGFGLAGVELLWQPRLRDVLGGASDTWIFGVVSAAYFIMGVVSNTLVTPLCSRLGGNYTLALSIIRVCMGAMLLSLAFQGGLFGFITFFLLVFMFNSMETSPHSAILNSEIPAERRSTILSFESLILQLGVVGGSATMGYISNTYDIPSAWTIGAVLVFASSLVFIAPAMREKGREMARKGVRC